MRGAGSLSWTSDRGVASMTDKPLILEHEGKPAYVVVRYEVWQDLLEQAEDGEAARAYDRAKAQPDQETVPIAVADALLAQQKPMRVWREYRRMTQDQLAQAAGIRRAYIAQLESGKRRGSTKVLADIARALGLGIDDLL
ncbi:MAG: helix-turn-helix transcriptional regulator [Geminicoccaceae bacterium]